MKKRIAKELRRVSNEMPVTMQRTKEVHYVKGSELIDQGVTTVKNPKWKEGDPEHFKELPVNPSETYVQEMPVEIATNHHRKLKKAFRGYGFIGVQAYVHAIAKHAAERSAEGEELVTMGSI